MDVAHYNLSQEDDDGEGETSTTELKSPAKVRRCDSFGELAPKRWNVD